MRLILISILCTIFTTALFAENKVSLIEDCVSGKCNPRKWMIIDRFEPGFLDTAFAPGKEWKPVEKFPIWLNKIYSIDSDLHTYTLITRFNLPEGFLEQKKEPGIKFGEIGEVFEIYINGQLVTQEGKIENGKITLHRTVRGQVYEVEREYLKQNDNVLLIKISGNPKFDHTGFYLVNGYEFGFFRQLEYEEQDRVVLALILVYIVVGLYHLFLFSRRKKDKHNFYFASYCLGLGIYLYTRTSAVFELPIDTILIQKIELSVLYVMAIMLSVFMESLLFKKISKTVRFFLFFGITLSILTILLPIHLAEYLLRLWQIIALPIFPIIVVIIIYKAIKKQIPAAKRLLIGNIIVILAAVFDILDSLVFNTGIAVSKYGFFIFVMGIATILADRFTELYKKTEDLNATLEKKVEARTRELTRTLDEVHALKNQQDGDYYLTSLLIRPLGTNSAKSNNVHIHFLVKQKKKFKFQKFSNDIGGDLCKSESIELRGKLMTVFFNADAMGKSIQGAGGAIVLGAVFRSIIERTKLSNQITSYSPERWLKTAFIELHKVFESFEGLMLVSIVFGIIDDSNGLMYYINAEHPNTILLRDGKASLMESDTIYRKLGSPLVNGSLMINVFQIYPGDIIINGSDGKDDILIPDQSGTQTMNHNENRILSIIEKAEGNLDKIVESLEKESGITDDLSLMRITWDGIPKPHLKELKFIHKSIKELDTILSGIRLGLADLEILKNLAISYFRKRQFAKAIICLDEYMETFPSDTEMLYVGGRIIRKSEHAKESVEFAERMRLRNPQHIKNIYNLKRIYKKLGNVERARKFEEEYKNMRNRLLEKVY